MSQKSKVVMIGSNLSVLLTPCLVDQATGVITEGIGSAVGYATAPAMVADQSLRTRIERSTVRIRNVTEECSGIDSLIEHYQAYKGSWNLNLVGIKQLVPVPGDATSMYVNPLEELPHRVVTV